MEGIDKGSDGDKDSNDEKDSREEDTGHANEKSISKVLSTGGTMQGHPTSQVNVLFHRKWQWNTTHAAGQDWRDSKDSKERSQTRQVMDMEREHEQVTRRRNMWNKTNKFYKRTATMENVKKGLLQDQTFTYSELWTL